MKITTISSKYFDKLFGFGDTAFINMQLNTIKKNSRKMQAFGLGYAFVLMIRWYSWIFHIPRRNISTESGKRCSVSNKMSGIFLKFGLQHRHILCKLMHQFPEHLKYINFYQITTDGARIILMSCLFVHIGLVFGDVCFIIVSNHNAVTSLRMLLSFCMGSKGFEY